MEQKIQFILNGKPVVLAVDGQRSLLWVLRTNLGLTGTKYGCGEGYCGACTVLVEDEAVRSCQLLVQDVTNKHVVTIEGLRTNFELHPLQRAFIEHDAMQCGFCTPGMIITAVGFLKKNPHPTRQEIIAAMDDNLCRCGSHQRILAAIEATVGLSSGGE